MIIIMSDSKKEMNEKKKEFAVDFVKRLGEFMKDVHFTALNTYELSEEAYKEVVQMTFGMLSGEEARNKRKGEVMSKNLKTLLS